MQILVTITDENYAPEEGDAFDAVVSALEHFGVPANLVAIKPCSHEQHIAFEPKERRAWQDDGPFFQGRNGLGFCAGVEVLPLRAEGMVRLTPFSTKGIANAWFDVPAAEAAHLGKAILAAGNRSQD